MTRQEVQTLNEDFDRILREAGAERSILAQVGEHEVCGYALWREGAPLVMLSAGIHGDEPAGPLAVKALLKQGLLDSACSWLICPLLNPHGLVENIRENADGVDLNRDYLKQVSAEVQGHVKWLCQCREKQSVDVFLSLHEDWESAGFYCYEINCGEDQPSRVKSLLKAVSEHVDIEKATEIDGHSVREAGWIYHRAEPDVPEGWPEAIFLAKLGCPLSFTLETPSQISLERRVHAHVTAVKELLNVCL